MKVNLSEENKCFMFQSKSVTLGKIINYAFSNSLYKFVTFTDCFTFLKKLTFMIFNC